MRILIITQKIDESDDVLGFFAGWVRAIAKRAERVYVICLAKGTFDLPENVEVVSLGKEHNASKFLQALRFYGYVWKFIFRTDGIFVHMAPEYVRALYPITVFVRKPILMWYAHIKVSPVAKWAVKHVDRIFTPSKESFSFDSDKVIATGHGINTETFAPMNIDPVSDIVAVSRISKVKRVETLIEAARILKERGRVVTVDIYGKPAREEDGEYFEKLKKLSESYGLERSIRWMGGVANKETPGIYASHRIFVRMQGGGGFGKTELEAMSMGVPSIVPTDVYKKSLGEFSEDLYFPEDDSQALADRIETVLDWDAEKKGRYAKLSRQMVVDKHNVENAARRIIEELKQCVA